MSDKSLFCLIHIEPPSETFGSSCKDFIIGYNSYQRYYLRNRKHVIGKQFKVLGVGVGAEGGEGGDDFVAAPDEGTVLRTGTLQEQCILTGKTFKEDDEIIEIRSRPWHFVNFKDFYDAW